MKFYHVYTNTYHNDFLIGTTMGDILVDEEPQTEILNLTWENLEGHYYKEGLLYKFNIWNMRKGRIISFFLDHIFPCKEERDVKEWKEKNLGIKIITTYEEFSPSIDYVLKWHDLEKAIIYLNEKNLKVKIDK